MHTLLIMKEQYKTEKAKKEGVPAQEAEAIVAEKSFRIPKTRVVVKSGAKYSVII